MSVVFKLVLAAVLTLAFQPAFAQSPGVSQMPPGAQNPAFGQPLLVPPPQTQLAPAPSPQPMPTGPQPGSPSAMIVPGGAGGLCECLNSHSHSASEFDKTRMHQRCLGSPDACQAACNTPYLFSFVPHATFTCPSRPEEEATGKVAANTRSVLRLFASR
jgi:hypothetical protein